LGVDIFARIEADGHEQVVFCHEPAAGYRGIIAIHDTTLGPALGGTRFWNYADEAAAVEDVLRLSRAMTYKAAMAGLDLGGGKAVIIGDPHTTDREAIFRAHGRFIESLKGRYITAADVGTRVSDLDFVEMETDHVTGCTSRSGDSGPLTAYGIYCGLRACALERYGNETLEGLRVAVQGLGSVGYRLCSLLADAGARLTVTDIDGDKVRSAVREFGAVAVDPDAIFDVDAEVFAPCALGGVINDETLPRMKFEIIAGGANNQLAEARHGAELVRREILYAPDYVINAGGVISVCGALQGWPPERSRAKAEGIFDTLVRLFEYSRETEVPTHEAADRLAEKRIEQVAKLHNTWL